MARKFTKYPSNYVKASKSSPKITGRTWSEFIANLKSAGYSIDSAYTRNYDQWIILYDNDGNAYNAEVTKYFNGDYELMEYNITKHYGDDIEASSNYKLPNKKLVFSDGDIYEFRYTSEEGDVFEPKSGSGNWWTSYIVTPDNKLLSWEFSGRYTPVDAVYGEDFWVEDNSVEACGATASAL